MLLSGSCPALFQDLISLTYMYIVIVVICERMCTVVDFTIRNSTLRSLQKVNLLIEGSQCTLHVIIHPEGSSNLPDIIDYILPPGRYRQFLDNRHNFISQPD